MNCDLRTMTRSSTTLLLNRVRNVSASVFSPWTNVTRTVLSAPLDSSLAHVSKSPDPALVSSVLMVSPAGGAIDKRSAAVLR